MDRGDSYRWQGPSTWACYRPDADILVPVFSPYGQKTILSPFAVERNISLLMRFDYPLNDGKSLVAHHGHRLRKELIDYWTEQPLNGSDLGLRSTKVSHCFPAVLEGACCEMEAANISGMEKGAASPKPCQEKEHAISPMRASSP